MQHKIRSKYQLYILDILLVTNGYIIVEHTLPVDLLLLFLLIYITAYLLVAHSAGE